MRPSTATPADVGSWLGELVGANSLGVTMPTKASGLLKQELR